jgi:2,3,4,5-tetrahydropyridine-2-carboxylate N-succinyltransferase
MPPGAPEVTPEPFPAAARNLLQQGRRAAKRHSCRMDQAKTRSDIEALVADPSGVRGKAGRIVDKVIEALDEGTLRVCEPVDGAWVTNAWVKQAILLYFQRLDILEIVERGLVIGDARKLRGNLPSFYDKLPTKRNYRKLGVRCVPPGVARYGSFLGRGAILMPGFVNIGAYVDEGTMVDTWATVGSCAQIGKNVHLSGGVGIGGVLEPPQAQPVIIEDGAFVGSRVIVVEGVRVGREAVLGAGVVLTGSTPIVDVRGSEPVVTRGSIPPRAVVIPGTQPKRFAAGEFNVPCALIIGERSAETDRKTSLESVLRDYGVAV